MRVQSFSRDRSLDCDLGIKVGDVRMGTIADLQEDSLGLDIGGFAGRVPHDRLGLRAGEVEHGPYQVGHVLPVRVQGVNLHGSFDCELVIKVGDVLEGTVAELRENSLGVKIKGWRGWVPHSRFGLKQNAKIPYRVGDTLAVRVMGINAGTSYGSFNCEPTIKVGDMLEGAVAELQPSSLKVDLGGQPGWVSERHLGLRAGEVETGPYKQGHVLPVRVLDINPDGSLRCELVIKVGDALIGKVAEFHPNSLGLDVDGWRVWLSARSLSLRDGEVENGLHEIGDWMIVRVTDVNAHGSFHCEQHSSVDLAMGRVVTARIVTVSNDGLTVNVDGVPGWISQSQMPLDPDAGVADLFRTGESINAAVEGVDEKNRRILLSVTRLWDDAASDLRTHTVVSARVAEFADEDGLRVTVNDLPGLVPAGELFQGRDDVTADLLQPGGHRRCVRHGCGPRQGYARSIVAACHALLDWQPRGGR